MTYRPHPDRARALRHLEHTRAVYRYGRFPQRYVLGAGPATAGAMEEIRGRLDRTAHRMALASYALARPVGIALGDTDAA